MEKATFGISHYTRYIKNVTLLAAQTLKCGGVGCLDFNWFGTYI